MSNHQRIVFMGTPDLAAIVLARMLEHQRHTQPPWQLQGVVTQPDRPRGRKRKPAESPVKQLAGSHGLPLLQPDRVRRNPEFAAQLAAWEPDAVVVMAYGQILPPSILNLPRTGCLNIHASLLPALRGASPIFGAVRQGLTVTGVSIMQINRSLDTGPVVDRAETAVLPRDTTGTLGPRLAELGAERLLTVLPTWLAGECRPIPQDALPGTPSHCGLIRKADGRIDWTRPATDIALQVRACNPWPAAHCWWQGQQLRVLDALPETGEKPTREPGRVLETDDGLAVQTGDGLLGLTTIQLAGRKAMAAADFRRGAGRNMAGSLLLSAP